MYTFVPEEEATTDNTATPSAADMYTLVEKFAETVADISERLEDWNITEPTDDDTFKLSPVHVRMPLVSSSVSVAFEVA